VLRRQKNVVVEPLGLAMGAPERFRLGLDQVFGRIEHPLRDPFEPLELKMRLLQYEEQDHPPLLVFVYLTS
jgi:hypothetical protein